MAGSPKRRARREAEERSGGRSARRFGRDEKLAILKRRNEVGAAAAAAEAGVAVGTLRTWAKRLAAEPVPAVVEPVGDREEGLSGAERLRLEARRERESAAKARDQADVFLARGDARGARDATVASRGFAEIARELEDAARAEELHGVTLREAEGRIVMGLVERAFELVEMPVPRSLLAALFRGGEPDAELVEKARAEVRRRVAGEVRVELLDEIEAQRLARPALPAGEFEESDQGEVVEAEVVPEPAAAGVSFADLPEDWKMKYRLRPDLGVYEWVNAKKREENEARGSLSSGGRHHLDFSHPGLAG